MLTGATMLWPKALNTHIVFCHYCYYLFWGAFEYWQKKYSNDI
jgi:hypothetical protein